MAARSVQKALERLERLHRILEEEIRCNPELAARVADALAPRAPAAPAPPAPRARLAPSRERAAPPTAPPQRQPQPPVLDPFAVYELGWEAMLSSRLQPLGEDQLRDIVHAHALDPKGHTRRLDTEALRAWIVERIEHSS